MPACGWVGKLRLACARLLVGSVGDMIDSQTLDFGPHRLTILASTPSYGYAEGTFVPGTPGPAQHRHDWDETFYVVAGTLEVDLDGTTTTLGTGDFVRAPAGAFHTFRVMGGEPARFVSGFHPGRGLMYVLAMADIFGPTGPDPDKLAALHAEFGVETR